MYAADDAIDIWPALGAYDGGGGCWLCRSSSPNVLWRPQRYTNAPPSKRTAAPPIAIPAIAPVERGGCEPDEAAATGVVGVAVTVAVVADAVIEVDDGAADFVDATSSGKFSPGLKATVELCAKACWTSRV